ncbi:PQQ-binding-like beta-propeller repeat protein [Schlesneria sp. DSM 10557]|uniref:outer membrane protein assembly factor BamB family protein n=1 Tax=Schlesneria sp. DSM 10557 TaxID=3044399 RepID=UPI0035A0C3AC
MSSPLPPDVPHQTNLASTGSLNGRWRWGAAILTVALVSQAVLLTYWWGDPTHSKMSVLFVWPAALFALTIWWAFFSGWSRGVRFGTLTAIAALTVAFLSLYRLEWDGAMVPRRFVLRSKPSGEEIARQYLKDRPSKSVSAPDAANAPEQEPLLLTLGDWPGYRGPNRDGVVTGGDLRLNWNVQPPREVWRHPVGRAWSSFAVIGNHAFTQEQRDDKECVVAYHVETGNELWVHEDTTILSIVDANGGPGPHATPQFDSGLLYSLGGTGILNCLDAASGKRIWTVNILADAGKENSPVPNIEWGMSCSPLVVDDLVIVIPGGTDESSGVGFDRGVAAYHKISGQLVWSAGKHKSSYGSPRLAELAGVRQLMIPNAVGLSGHDSDTGRELWFFPLENGSHVNSTMPWVIDEQSLIFGTGYGVGSVRLQISQTGDKWSAEQMWKTNRFRPKFNEFVVHEGHAYGLDDGTLACLDIETGKIKWRQGRYGYGQLLLVDSTLLIITEDGELLLLPAEPVKPEVIASMKVLDSGFCWNHPVLVRGKLLLRNAVEAVCFDVSKPQNDE